MPRVPGPRPTAFDRAAAGLQEARLRPEVRLAAVPAPARIAPQSFALAGEVVRDGDELATGRFVLLHDPAAPAQWGGRFRVVTLASADLEADLGADPLLGPVAWSWLEDGLRAAGADAVRLGGTVTRVVSESYGELSHREASVDVEVRASWTPAPGPDGDLDAEAHLQAWCVLLCSVAGLPPLPEGVVPLAQHPR
ncbi:DUF3000 domain-containing protein [Kineococcus glutinatus]|uniref:DUF3000 domain-containing protein n=1 Tax=Kineococcus glutinatus TaxID=1070872 RepID=A0ABP8VBY3_9ACTN